MQILLHGGKCCGIKHIFGLEFAPHGTVDAKRKNKPPEYEGDGYVTSNRNFFHIAAPQESAGERFDRMLEFLDDRRPGGICEVVLADWQRDGWHDFVVGRGFKETTSGINSNSDNTVTIYHRVTANYTPEEEED